MSKTIIITQDDIKNPLHPNLWYDILEGLGVDSEAEQIELCLSSLDENKKAD